MGKHEHKHIEASGASLAKAARDTLEKGGEAWTDMRAAIFDAVAQIGKPASAYEIADIVSQNRGKRVAPNSVYRILDLFVANNLVRRVESANAFVANSHPGCLHDCIFLICDSCGAAVHVDDDKIAGGVRAAAEATGFSAERPVIEVRGKCAECQ
ncbi:Fur family transcriptional regulator [Sphingopyxis indica]|uniref:Fur family transcriptional regulator, zinc uptake regulator n=1 Tax=Sphingopyxis indica TaxID=436663 RepID=A0A239GG96_9SPHN|nr:Fur family transcriptional regulator [Sphingopyxis indica]WOF44050.1 transcriptional repressor [Sphingopyxis indica]SNS67758.1 Fur family transcriptional regulator, zinc uptake regulator [Sphingopyxis indica]